MALIKDAYLALEDIVGSEYITQDPAILDTYNQVWGNKLVFDEKWSTRPGAVILPGNTEEVQKIVRVCNRYKITFKPFSSGFEVVSTALITENSIILDLRRMDRILDIDVKNMTAIVEPYVSNYRLQMELAKHGLFNSTICCGPSGGVIAAACAHFGSGVTMVSTGGLGRNVLGTEWVLPTGELIKLGTAEAGGGWFSADGPGPSLRGILRGQSGANGGHGVFTKASVKLYPWYGPPKWEFKGPLPSLKQPEKVLDGYKLFLITFPSEDHLMEAAREIGQAEIAYSMSKVHGPYLDEGNDELWAMVQKLPKEALGMANITLQVLIGAPTNRAMEYREQCLLKIMERREGKLLPELNDPKDLAWHCMYMIWSMGTVRETFRMASDFFIAACADGTQDMVKKIRAEAIPCIQKYIDDGSLVNPGGFAFHLPYEHYSIGSHLENIFQYDPFDEKSLEGTRKLMDEALDPKGQFRSYGVPLLGGGLQIEPASHVVQNWGPEYDRFDVWLRKIKESLDPNNLGDWSAYVPPIFP
ncbi:MAG: FAD-binding oxidoreductase [Clostridia bacterium]|nr:FAD-binding oxidoreductase [Clostridia bacterium]